MCAFSRLVGCRRISLLVVALLAAACRADDVEIRHIGLLEPGTQVPAGASVGVAVDVDNPRARTLEFKWSAALGQFNSQNTKVPSNIYRAPAAGGVDTVSVEVLGGTAPVARSMQLTVLGQTEDTRESAAQASARAAQAKPSDARSLNERLTAAAWDAFNAGKYEEAIGNARKCVDEFRGQADRDQAELTRLNAPLPPTGKVGAAERNAILARGILNDVATCLVIVGQSAQALTRIAESREAYQAATRYPHARCFDPANGLFFWSPAEMASDRLALLTGK